MKPEDNKEQQSINTPSTEDRKMNVEDVRKSTIGLLDNYKLQIDKAGSAPNFVSEDNFGFVVDKFNDNFKTHETQPDISPPASNAKNLNIKEDILYIAEETKQNFRTEERLDTQFQADRMDRSIANSEMPLVPNVRFIEPSKTFMPTGGLPSHLASLKVSKTNSAKLASEKEPSRFRNFVTKLRELKSKKYKKYTGVDRRSQKRIERIIKLENQKFYYF
jgi:hypothetical protein